MSSLNCNVFEQEVYQNRTQFINLMVYYIVFQLVIILASLSLVYILKYFKIWISPLKRSDLQTPN